jgi:hypothetical protein
MASELGDVSVNVDVSNLNTPNTRRILLEGLRQGLQGRVAQVWSTVTTGGEPDPAPRFIKGITNSVKAYEQAWAAINKHYKDDDDAARR